MEKILNSSEPSLEEYENEIELIQQIIGSTSRYPEGGICFVIVTHYYINFENRIQRSEIFLPKEEISYLKHCGVGVCNFIYEQLMWKHENFVPENLRVNFRNSVSLLLNTMGKS